MNKPKQSAFGPAPRVTPRPEELRHLDDLRIDPYYYLRNKELPELQDYLRAENAYTEEVMASTKELQEEIYQEIVGRIKETDQSYPTLRRGYYYYTRTEQGRQYPSYYRYEEEAFDERWSERPQEVEGGELIFDVNLMAEGQPAYIFAGYSVSPDNRWVAYMSNTTGSYAEFDLRIKSLQTGQELPLCIAGVASLAWAEDSETIYYSLIDETLRSSRVLRQRLDEAEGQLIYEELDSRFSCSVSETKTHEYLFISCSSSTSSEEYYLAADGRDTEPKLLLVRQPDVRYSVLTHRDRLYLYYKDKEQLNGALYATSLEGVADRSSWCTILAHRPEVRLESLGIYEHYVVTEERVEGLSQIRILDPLGQPLREVAFPEPVYTLALRGSSQYSTRKVRYTYSSPNRPSSLYEYDLETGQSRLLKQQEVGGGYQPEDYVVERRWALGEDGTTRIPMALLYRKGLKRDGSAPALIYGYGSYGISMEAQFSVSILSLVDRGFVYALAQVRGGSELGEQWYEDGKFLKKEHTFTDFAACARLLVDEAYTSPERLAAMGGSAGGMLMGVVANRWPELFGCIVAQVPFVDVVTTMLDDSLPLTTGEYEEWGNPNESEYYHYMKGYSPYDNLRAQRYPAMLVTGGINDSQVLFHEPTKYVAKLRSLKTDDELLLLRMNMDSGHGGATGRYSGIRDTAFEYAFILYALGLVS